MTAPRMAAAKAFCREPASANRAMMTDSIRSKDRAGRSEATSTRWAKERGQRRRNYHAIKSHEREKDVLGEVHLSSPA